MPLLSGYHRRVFHHHNILQTKRQQRRLIPSQRSLFHWTIMMIGMLSAFRSGSSRVVMASSYRQQRPCAFLYRNALLSRSLTAIRTRKNSSSNNNQDVDISSTKSNTVKQFQQLIKKSSKRIENKQTIVESPKIITELLTNSKTKLLIQHVLVSVSIDDNEAVSSLLENQYSNYDDDDELYPNYRVSFVTPQVLKACTDTVTPQGMVALCDIPPSFEVIRNEEDIISIQDIDNDDESDKYPLYLILDGVSDPGNVGTLLRSSLAVGVSGIILLPECCDVWNPKAIRSAMGSTFYLPKIIQVSSWNIAQKWLIEVANVQQSNIYAATMLEDDEDNGDSKTSQAYFNIDWKSNSPCALVIGSEGKGLNQDIRDALSQTGGDDGDDVIQAVHVPMIENSMESLNAAVCGSVILFDYLRQKMT